MTRKITLRELSEALSCEMQGDPEWVVTGVDSLKTAKEKDLSFFGSAKYASDFNESQAGIICVTKEYKDHRDRNYLVCENPSIAFQQAIKLLCHDSSPSGFKGIHPTSVVHQSVKVGKNVTIGPHVVIDRDVSIGDNTIISPHVSIGPEVKIGSNCHIYPNVVIREGCTLGCRVILQPGVVIGGCGYGYVQNERNESQKIKHLGGVDLEDDVEVGANSTIDRGMFKSTKIRKGAKIDNLVMLAHNTEIGENTLVIAQSGIAGSTQIGKNCIIAAQSGIGGHLKIGDQVIITAKSGVSKSIPKSGIYGSGILTAVPTEEYRRRSAHINRLEKYATQIKILNKRVATLEKDNIEENACHVKDS